MIQEIMILQKTELGYWPKSNNMPDDLLSSLWSVLDEGKHYMNQIKKQIFNNKVGKFPGNSSLVILEKEKAYIQPLYGEDADEYRLEMEKDNLLEVLNEWEELMKKQPQEIILMINKKGLVTIKQQK
jgi:hypothetical protein